MASHFKIAANAAFTEDVTEFYQDPLGGEYNPRYEWKKRGSILSCLSGVQAQDFGLDMQDRKILIRDTDAMHQSHVDALQAKYEAKGVDWYFTDGAHVFKVRFWDFQPVQNVKWLVKGLHRVDPGDPIPADCDWWSYEIILLVREVVA